MVIMLLVIGMFVALGMVFINGKGASLIAGYNTMSTVEKEKYDEVALCKFIGKMMFALASSMVLWVLSDLFHVNWLYIVGLILFIVIIVCMIIYMNTENRFKK